MTRAATVDEHSTTRDSIISAESILNKHGRVLQTIVETILDPSRCTTSWSENYNLHAVSTLITVFVSAYLNLLKKHAPLFPSR